MEKYEGGSEGGGSGFVPGSRWQDLVDVLVVALLMIVSVAVVIAVIVIVEIVVIVDCCPCMTV